MVSDKGRSRPMDNSIEGDIVNGKGGRRTRTRGRQGENNDHYTQTEDLDNTTTADSERRTRQPTGKSSHHSKGRGGGGPISPQRSNRRERVRCKDAQGLSLKCMNKRRGMWGKMEEEIAPELSIQRAMMNTIRRNR